MSVPFTTDATATNRQTVLHIDDGTTGYGRSGPAGSQGASLAWTHVWGRAIGAAGTIANEARGSILPADLLLLSGHRLRTITANLQAGDNYGPLVVYVLVTLPGTEGEWGDPHGERWHLRDELHGLRAAVDRLALALESE